MSSHPVKVLYLAGATRSGSTLLHNVLAQIDGFEGVGELRDIWHHGVIDNRLCGCGTTFGLCPYWTGVIDGTFGSIDAVDASDPHERTEAFRTRDLLMSLPSGRRRAIDAGHGILATVRRPGRRACSPL